MILLTEFSVTMDISALIIASVFLLVLLIMFIIKLCSRGRLIVDGVDFGLDGFHFQICNDKMVRQTAYKIWVEINTRVIGVKVDLDKDIIRSIHESYYLFFTTTRQLIEDIPANNFKRTKELVFLVVSFLNDVMRPYLTKWGIKFNEWYDREKESQSVVAPQDFQKRFNEYNELSQDLLALNNNVIYYSNALKRIAFKEKLTKNKRHQNANH